MTATEPPDTESDSQDADGTREADDARDADDTETTDETCRVCVLFDGEYTTRWVAAAIETMLEETDTEIPLVVINEDSGLLSTANLRRGRRYPAWAAYWATTHAIDSVLGGPAYADSVHIGDIDGVGDARWLRCEPAEIDGLRYTLPEWVVSEVAAEADLVFRRGFEIIQGGILTEPEHGVVSYHHGDPRKYRGAPAGFWEFMHDESRVGMMVQALAPELDAGGVLAYDEIDVTECATWREIRIRLYERSVPLLAEAVENRLDPDFSPMEVDEHGPVYTPASLGTIAKFLMKNNAARVRAAL